MKEVTKARKEMNDHIFEMQQDLVKVRSILKKNFEMQIQELADKLLRARKR